MTGWSDLIVLHIDGSDHPESSSNSTMGWMNAFIKGFNSFEEVMIVIVAGLVRGPLHDDKTDNMDGYSIQRPLQSIEKTQNSQIDFDRDFHFLSSRRLRGSVRVDDRDRFREVSRFDAYSAIPIDRLIPEIAYLIGRSSKFGS